MQKKLLYCVIVFCCMAAGGCAQNQLLNMSGRSDESISTIKNYQDVLTPEFRFLGKVAGAARADWSSTVQGGSTFESESLLYGQVGDGNIITRGLIVRTYKVRGEAADRLPGPVSSKSDALGSGTVKITGRTLAYELMAESNFLQRHEAKIIHDKGYTMSACYLVKAYSGKLAGFFEKATSHIIYFENSEDGQAGISCARLAESVVLSADQKMLMNEFGVRGDTTVGTLLGGGAAPETAVAETSAPTKTDVAVPTTGTTELERKLSTLKKLLDKGYITQEDYDKKKLELLENF